MSMKFEKTENANELKLEFEIEAAKFDAAMKKVYAENAKYFNIAGFRKGKAPMAMVEKQYGSEIFYEDAFNEVLTEVYPEELEKNNIEVVSKPNIDVQQIGKGQDLKFTAIIQIKPEVKLGKYKGIEIKKVEYNVSDEDIDHELGHMAEKNSRIVVVEDRAVEENDIAIIDFEGFVDGVAFEGGKAENHELTIGSKTFIPGFEDQLIGMKSGEEKDVNVKFPEEYFSEDLKGKDATFKVKLHEIKKKELPEINDEFANDVSEFDTIKELKASIKEKLEKENEKKAKYETEETVMKAIVEKTEVDIPSGMVETEIDNVIKDMEMRLQYQGMNMEQYLKMMNKSMEDFRKEYEEEAKKSVKSRLTLEAIIKAENFEADAEAVTAKAKEMATLYGKSEKELLDNKDFMNYIQEMIKSEKALEFVVANAKIK